jgi:integrase
VKPKTPRSQRTIPLPDVVREALNEHIAKYPPLEDGSLFYMAHGWRRRVKGWEGPVRQHPYIDEPEHKERQMIDRGYYARIFKEAVIAADLPLKAGDRLVTSHDLRHHFASVLLDAGESVFAVADILGHANAREVLTTYGDVMPNQEERARKAIDAKWKEARRVA